MLRIILYDGSWCNKAMSDNEQNQDITTSQEPSQSPEEFTLEPSIQSADSNPIVMPPEAPESPTNASTHTCPTKNGRN